jgi:hypothetical protein
MSIYDGDECLLSVSATVSATESDIETLNRHFPLNGGCSPVAADAIRNERDTDLSGLSELMGFQIYLTPDMSGYELESETERLRIFRHRATK